MANSHALFPSPVEQFIAAIAEQGLTPPNNIIADGQRHYFSSNGKAKNSSGWYVFNDGHIATGAFGDFRTGKGIAEWVANTGRFLTSEEKLDFQRQQDALRRQRDAEMAERRAKAKEKALGILRISQPASANHPYLVRKGVKAHAIRSWKDLLLIPMIDHTGEVQSLQLISGDGGKKFLAGGKMQGCYFPIGEMTNAKVILIAEGYATAATLHETTKQPVVVAYNAGNLLSVAQTIRAQNPHASIVICADDDNQTENNPGLTKGAKAAAAIDGALIIPDFGPDRPDGATDFNDMAAHCGKAAVSDFFIGQNLTGVAP